MSSRERILARRAKFIAAAIASAGAIGCSDDTTAQVCLEPMFDGGSDTGSADANADTKPMPCLDPVVDTGVMDATDSGVSDTNNTDADPDTGPMPCLKMPPPDGG